MKILENSESQEVMEKKKRIMEIGQELFLDGGLMLMKISSFR